MPSSHKLYPKCERMFVNENKSLSEIHNLTGVALSTLSKWKRDNGWEQRRNDWQNSSLHIAERLKYLLSLELSEMDKLDNGTVDKIIKTIKSVKYLDEDADILGNTILVMEQFGIFLQIKHQKMFRTYQALLPDFLIYMREKFKKN